MTLSWTFYLRHGSLTPHLEVDNCGSYMKWILFRPLHACLATLNIRVPTLGSRMMGYILSKWQF